MLAMLAILLFVAYACQVENVTRKDYFAP